MNNKKRNEAPQDWIGNRHPFPPDKKKPTLLKENDYLTTIFGYENHEVAPKIFVSTARMTICIWDVSPGQSFQPPDIHSGDESYYVFKGRPTIVNPETGQASQAKEGDLVLIPAKSWHTVFNFTEEEVVLITIIAGPVWDESDIEMVRNYKLKPSYYKTEEE